MKTLTLLLILLCSNLQAQIIDTEKSIDDINLNLDKFHKEYKVGTVFNLVGGTVALVGIASLMNDSDQPPSAVYFGAFIMSVGTIIHIDSHKFLNPKRRR